MFRRRVPKPKLKVPGQVRLKKKRNDYMPGFVYIFHDTKAIRGKGITMCKIGLSRTPRRRKYYLSEEYESNLRIKAIVPTFNMRLTEILMHKIFADSRNARTPRLDGYTEWFQVDFFRIKMIQITLFASLRSSILLTSSV
jgi:hypothetical protein